ncbi:MAG: hypothetical protein AB1750_18215 [Chloroflexota bacterium]
MNLLDENIREDQRGLLQSWGIPVRQIGVDVGQKGIKDNEIITLLHKLRDATFFTRDLGFYSRDVCHARYCLVCLAVEKDEVAVFVRRFLRHPEFDEKSKRMGCVIRASHTRLTVWQKNVPKETEIGW